MDRQVTARETGRDRGWPPRCEDWPARLDAVLSAARRRPHVWGDHDCCLFGADARDAICGIAPDRGIAAHYRGRYKTVRGARGLLKRLGGINGLMQLAGPEIPVAMAQRGDLVLLPAERIAEGLTDVTLAVCAGDSAAGPGLDGLVFVPMSVATRAWAVGRRR